MNLFFQLLVNGLINGALYAMLAIGFGIIWRSFRIFHIVYGGLYILCTYLFYQFIIAGIPTSISLFLTLACAVFTGLLIETFLYRPFFQKSASSSAVLIASLGALVVVENIIVIIFGNELRYIARNILQPFRIGPIILTSLQVIQFISGVIVTVIMWIMTRRLRIFKALWAMGDQPELISVLGLPIHLLRNFGMIISTILVTIPACLICLDLGVDPHAGMRYLLIAVVSVMVGGTNSFGGWVAGAFVLALMQSIVVWKFSARWIDLFTFSLLITLLIFRPEGLFSLKKRIEDAQ
jgi:branched-subunit amino acid ABC-type transport system permease component